MPRRFEFMDVFSRNSRDNRVQTTSGAMLTLLAITLFICMLKQQVSSFLHLEYEPQVLIDKARDEKLEILLDFEFPHLPCDLLSVDAMDVAGDVQSHVEKNLIKTDLDEFGNPADSSIKAAQAKRRDEAIAKRKADATKPRPCYGARKGEDDNTCLSCEDVRTAYAELGWKFHDGAGFQQCVEEGYPDSLRQNSKMGCRVTGHISVGKVIGNLHLAPGTSSVSASQAHLHDLSGYALDYPYDCSHKIHAFSFSNSKSADRLNYQDPLEGIDVSAKDKWSVFRYFTKVVSTETRSFSGDVTRSNQYSVTKHERSLGGGWDPENPNTYHGVGGIPGIWITYDISPLRIINVERRQQSLGALVLNMCAILGAVVTSVALLDRGIYEIDQALRARKAL